MLFNVGKLIVSNYVAVSINNVLIAGHFSHKGLRQLHTKLFLYVHKPDFCTKLTKTFVAEMSCNQLLIDTAT